MAPFKLVSFYSELDKDYMREEDGRGRRGRGAGRRRTNLTPEELEATDRIVAVVGVHPFIKALEMGADVIIGGSSSDAAIFAAAAIYEGFPESHSYYLGKVLECASFCAEPYVAKESVIGTITQDDVKVTAMHPEQRCTVASVAGHAMYERSNAFNEYLRRRHAGHDRLPVTNNSMRRPPGPRDRSLSRSRGGSRSSWKGPRKIGERFIGIAGIRDPYYHQAYRQGDRLGPQPGR